MKTDELTLTAEEIDVLCRLYMDCKLSVLEEKELEYILCTTSLTSPSIDEVKSLMKLQLLPRSNKTTIIRTKKFWNWKYFAGAAAGFALVVSVALYIASPRTSSLYESNSKMYVAAYSFGKRLNHNEAVEANNLAMAKADSLMNYASLTESDYMIRANNIINETISN